jgi:threonine/homoserine/homoserine lactone efflux protein
MFEASPLLIYMGVVAVLFLVPGLAVILTLALSAARVSQWIGRNSSIGKWQGKVVGGIYIALGLQLALQERR